MLARTTENTDLIRSVDMERIRGQFSKQALIPAGAALVLGLLLGLFFAWVVWPVSWTDAPVSSLRADLQRDYLAMAVQSYQVAPDQQVAQQRWNEMGDNKLDLLNQLQVNPAAPVSPDAVNSFAAAVGAGGLPPVAGGEVQPTDPFAATTVPGGDEKAGGSNLLNIILGAMCVLTLGIAGLLAYLFFFKNRRPGIGGGAARTNSESSAPMAEAPVYAEGQEPPIVQYLTTYNLGNDLYDDSFSIDSPSGEFLGECGVGISDTIGVGDPKKVTAFEVWLFDKNDIQTVTKVVMSQHAFNDPAVSQRLASKGEPVLAEPSKRILLETATLQLEARIVNMNYGQGALPANSFFEQITLELAVWQK
jgi:hypothetical protein